MDGPSILAGLLSKNVVSDNRVALIMSYDYSPGPTDVTNCVATLLFWLFR